MSTAETAPGAPDVVLPVLPEELERAPLAEQREWLVTAYERMSPRLPIKDCVTCSGIPVATYHAIRKKLGIKRRQRKSPRAAAAAAQEVAEATADDERGASHGAARQHRQIGPLSTYRDAVAMAERLRHELDLLEADVIRLQYNNATLVTALRTRDAALMDTIEQLALFTRTPNVQAQDE
jgi:hypothetical protein